MSKVVRISRRARRAGRAAWWRLVAVGLSVLALCSCRATPPGPSPLRDSPSAAAALPDLAAAAGTPARASLSDGGAAAAPVGSGAVVPASAASPAARPCPACSPGSPEAAPSAWRPPGLVGPWPRNEYVCNGGGDASMTIDRNNVARGLEVGHAAAQYATPDGRRRTTSSNPVCVYSPRFAAVRQVLGLVQHDQVQPTGGVGAARALELAGRVDGPERTAAPVRPSGQLGLRSPHDFHNGQAAGAMDRTQALAGARRRTSPRPLAGAVEPLPLESSAGLRGVELSLPTVTLAHDGAVQMTVNGRAAAAAGRGEALQAVVVYEPKRGQGRLELTKEVSAAAAHPGDVLTLTIRVRNTGTEPASDVAVLDNLPARLEYVADSASCSVDAAFAQLDNEVGSQVLRWDLGQPLAPGEEAVIQFRCLVR